LLLAIVLISFYVLFGILFTSIANDFATMKHFNIHVGKKNKIIFLILWPLLFLVAIIEVFYNFIRDFINL